MGVRYGSQPSRETVLYARNMLPAGAEFTGIGIGRATFTTVARSYLAGGHVRVGLEDSVYLSHGQLAPSNATLVHKARRIVEDLGGQIATPREARDIIGLPTRLAGASPVALADRDPYNNFEQEIPSPPPLQGKGPSREPETPPTHNH